MRLSRALALVLAGVLASVALGAPEPSRASSVVGAIVGSCELVSIQVRPTAEGNTLTTPDGGICAVSEYSGPNVAASAAQVPATVEITSLDVGPLICSGGTVRGFRQPAPVTFTVHGSGVPDVFHVTMTLDGAPGSQAFNPAATTLIQGLRFAGAGSFTRSQSTGCSNGSGSAKWTLGHLTFEDPTL